jgi:hypothetical protein
MLIRRYYFLSQRMVGCIIRTWITNITNEYRCHGITEFMINYTVVALHKLIYQRTTHEHDASWYKKTYYARARCQLVTLYSTLCKVKRVESSLVVIGSL